MSYTFFLHHPLSPTTPVTMAKRPAADPELSAILNELWKLDVNRLKPGIDYTINLQGKADYVEKGSNSGKDKASAPLFTFVNEDKLKSIPTYNYFMKLLNNYEMSTDVVETVTKEELEENNLFLNAILKTEVMKRAHKYLISKGLAPSNEAQFKELLNNIWFKLYGRGKTKGDNSCGFEHVFVGELKNGKEIMGLHNWVQFYLQEKLKVVDYRGYNSKDMPDVKDHVINLQFSWKSLVKPIGSSFIGVSPEFELALFTIVFLKSNDHTTNTVISLNKYLLEIVVCHFDKGIGTSYPKLLSSNNRDF